MEDKELASLETFVLSSDRPLDSFVPGTFLHQYFTFTQLLAAGDLKAIADQNLIQRLVKLSPEPSVKGRVTLSHALKRIELETDPAALKKALEAFNSDYLKYQFAYARPTHAHSAGGSDEQHSNVLTPIKLPLEEAHRDLGVFNQFAPAAYPLFNVDRMSDAVFLQFVQKLPLALFPKAIPRLGKIIVEHRLFHTLNSATVQQIEELSRAQPSLVNHHEFVRAWLCKDYADLLEAKPDELNDLHAIYTRLHSNLTSLIEKSVFPVSYLPFLISIRRQLLILGIELGRLDHKLFEEYLKAPLGNSFYVVKLDTNSAKHFSEFYRVQNIEERDLLYAYFDDIFRTKSQISPYDAYIEPNFLNKIFVRARILAGVPPTDFSDVLPPTDMQGLIEGVEVEFSKSNPRFFERSEAVVLKVQLKNVKHLLVRLFVLNTLAFYLQHQSQIQTDIDLDGLIPSTERILEFDVSPLVRNYLDLEVPGLENKAGVFVLELIGNGRSSRAVIKKGSLKFVSKYTSGGSVLKVLDESNAVCKGDGAGVYLDGRFYSTNNPQGQVTLPFATDMKIKQLIVTDGVFSELYEGLTHREETYSLQGTILLPSEAAIRGTRAKMTLALDLYLNHVAVSLSLLTDLKATLTIKGQEDTLASKSFPDLVLAEGSRYVDLEMEIPPKAMAITVQVSASVQPISKKNKVALRWDGTSMVGGLEDKDSIIDYYLRLTLEGYVLEVRGKDGNLKDGVEVSLTQHSALNPQSKDTQVLRTVAGVIKLGSLDGTDLISVVNTSADAAATSIQASWDIASYRPKVKYPQALSLVEDDEFTLPLERKLKEGDRLSLQRMSGTKVISLSDKYEVDDEALEVTLRGLDKGEYVLNLLQNTLKVTVYKGSHWGRNQFILTENSVVYSPSQYQPVGIKAVTASPESVKVQLNGDFAKAKVHVYLSSFLSDANSNTPIGLCSQPQLSKSHRVSESTFPHAQNVYLGSRLLDEEIRYALERKQLEKVMGNTLPRPQLALKRMEISSTETETQRAASGTNYENKSMRSKLYQDGHQQAYSDHHFSNNVHQGLLPQARSNPSYDFLASPAVLVMDIEPNEQGIAELTGVCLGDFSSAQVIVTNFEYVSSAIVPLRGSVKTKDVTHKMALDIALTYAERLRCDSVTAGQTFTVRDASSELKIVDSVSKQLSVLKELSRENWVALDWDWLGEWDRLSAGEKLGKYDEFISHELNLFLYAKDPAFFVEVVRPFLADKIEKTFIDKWLLGESLEEFYGASARLDRIGSRLNALELALLVKAVRTSHPELAGRIARLIEDAAKGIPTPEARRRRVFTRVLSIEFKDELNLTDQGNHWHDFLFTYRARKNLGKKFGCPPMSLCMLSSYMRDSNDGDFDDDYSEEFEENYEEDFQEMKGGKMEDKSEKAPKPYYEKLDSTKEYAETHYYKVPNVSQFRSLVPFSQFYADLARAFLDGKDAVLGESFIKCTTSPTDSYAALAFTDLPFRPARQGFEPHERGFILTANSNFAVFHKVLEAVEPEISDSLLVTQKYFDYNDRFYIDEDGDSVDKTVKQFLKDKVYGCQVIISNTSSKNLSVDVVAEIPEGALPVVEQDYSFVKSLTVSSYATSSLEFHFYFPSTGSYRHFPANVAIRGVVRAVARSQILTVIDRPSLESLESFKDIVSSGDTELIIRKLSEKNLLAQDFNLDDVLWMARDPALYSALLKIFRQKSIFDDRLWAFSVLHSDVESFKELLESREDIASKLSLYSQSSLAPRRQYRHLDYFPLVNARAHQLGSKSKITNTKFRQVYRDVLMELAEKPALETYDLVAIAHYWVLQDRLLEAKQLIDTRLGDVRGLQLDYIRAYLDLPNAFDLASRYSSYPVKAWKDLFAEVTAQLTEASQLSEYHETQQVDEPDLVFTIGGGGVVRLEYTGVTEATLSIYEVDLEVLFCRNPFFSASSQDFSFVTPNFKTKIQLDPERREASVSLPEQYQNKNVLVEVEHNGVKKSTSHFATSLKVQVLELYGQVKVSSADFKPLPLTYVKAFAQLYSGENQFYKDGYTDIRGRFDFVSLNTDLLEQVSRFSLYIEHEQFGSLTVEASPPPS
jgi:hypothetical protein